MASGLGNLDSVSLGVSSTSVQSSGERSKEGLRGVFFYVGF